MAGFSDLVSSLVTYGLISEENHGRLKEMFTNLFDEVEAGTGGELLSSSVAGRSFTFAKSDTTVNDMFTAVGRALRILGGRSKTRSIMRF